MSEITVKYPYLCGGTFFTLLLEATKPGLKSRKVGDKAWGEKNPFTEAEVLKALVGIVDSAHFNPNSSDVSTYKSCNPNKSGCLPIANQAGAATFDDIISNNFQDTLIKMKTLVDKYVDVSGKGKWLVKALLDMLKSDKSINDKDEFHIKADGKAVKRVAISKLNKFCLEAFLLGIWHYVISTRYDKNSQGHATYNEWCKGEKYAQKTFKSDIGSGIKRAIEVYCLTGVDTVADENTDKPTTETEVIEADELCEDGEPQIDINEEAADNKSTATQNIYVNGNFFNGKNQYFAPVTNVYKTKEEA
jgi:hypothetical protein